MKLSLKYKLKKMSVKIRRAWIFSIFNTRKKYQLASDIDLAIKVVMKMVSSEGCDIRYSPREGYYHLNKGSLYAKVCEQSITLINGRYAYELLLPPEAGFDLHTRIRMMNERLLIKAEKQYRQKVDRSLQNIYNDLYLETQMNGNEKAF